MGCGIRHVSIESGSCIINVHFRNSGESISRVGNHCTPHPLNKISVEMGHHQGTNKERLTFSSFALFI